MIPVSADERFDKLPKWARDKVQVLENGYRDAHARLEEYEALATGTTPIRIVGYGRPDTVLPNHSTIRFQIGQYREECVEVGFEYESAFKRERPIGVSVRSGGRVYIEPQASNVFVAKCEMRADRVQKQDAGK
jgi:hypothetical protein